MDEPGSDATCAGALLVIDVQRGFDEPHWGERNNPACEDNIASLIAQWTSRRLPIVAVRHDSREAASPLRPTQPGNAFKNVVSVTPDLLVTKSAHSAFHGDIDLHDWLQGHRTDRVTICGITTNHCCETTARVACDLGYAVQFVLDATHTFDRVDLEGNIIKADEIARVTAANLQDEFAQVVRTRELLSEAARTSPSA